MRSTLLCLLIFCSLVAHAQFERGAPLPRRGQLGVTAQLVAGKLKVASVVPNGTAEQAGVKVGDILLSLNGHKLKTVADLLAQAHRYPAGAVLTFDITRGGENHREVGAMQERPRATEPGLDVIYDQVLTKGKRVRLIITKPKGDGPFPAVFLIGGIGAYSVDAPMKSMPYGRVLGPIANEGYVTVRVDKPGQGDSEGPEYKKLGFMEEEDAYLQALRLTKSLPYVDPKRVAIYGHSMGGCFGPIVAGQEPVKAVIVNGTLFASFAEYMLENDRRQSEIGGEPADRLDTEQKEMAAVDYYIFDQWQSPASVIRHHPELAARVRGAFPDGETFSGVGLPFFQELSHVNLAAAWKDVKADVLAVYGENDFLSGITDHQRIVNYVNSLRPGTAELKVLPNCDHVWTKTTSMKDSMTKWGHGGEFNPIIVETLKTYLNKELKSG